MPSERVLRALERAVVWLLALAVVALAVAAVNGGTLPVDGWPVGAVAGR